VKTHDPFPRDDPPGRDGRLELDMGGQPSAYSLAQGSAEVKGLTLHPDDALERCRQLQRQAGEHADREQHVLRGQREARLRALGVATVLLWIAVLVVLLERL